MEKLQELIRYNGGVATRAEAAEGLLTAGVPFAWVIRYLSDAVAMTNREAAKIAPRFAKFAREHDRDELGRLAFSGKPAHEMTHAEFAASIPGRVVREPSLSLAEWAKAAGRESDAEFDKSDLNIAELIGGLLTQSTRHGKGKVKPLIAKLATYNSLHADYKQAVQSGVVAMTERIVPLHPESSAADQAYIRAMHKRAIYKAIGAGLTVPPDVLKDYPGVAETKLPPAETPVG